MNAKNIQNSDYFQTNLLTWFVKNGRKHLPWQHNKTPYRVWVSEIMLQQTQVSTATPYFERFMLQFPDVATLAQAPIDDVLHLWTGLGYYTRARNLHRSAKMIMTEFSGHLPPDLEQLQRLPGIGQSTAGAILSIAFRQKATILDGNVKRVLTRFHGIREWAGEKETLKKLWDLAEKHTPSTRTAQYTQAIMDMGATLCTRSKPKCDACPVSEHCVAFNLKLTKEIPKSKPKLSTPLRQASLLLLMSETNTLLLQKRPPSGIWGGLWSPPQIAGLLVAEDAKQAVRRDFGLSVRRIECLPIFRHTFSHFRLDILPIIIRVSLKHQLKIMAGDHQIWYNLQSNEKIGLPAPIKKLLMELLSCPE